MILNGRQLNLTPTAKQNEPSFQLCRGESRGESIHIKGLQREEPILGVVWVEFGREERFVVSFEDNVFTGFGGRGRHGRVWWWRNRGCPGRSPRLGGNGLAFVPMRMRMTVAVVAALSRVSSRRHIARPVRDASYVLESKHPAFVRDGRTPEDK